MIACTYAHAPDTPGGRRYMVKRVNSTNAHYGVMGQWQMRGAWAHQADTPTMLAAEPA
jgi:hypothetical protein